LFCNVSPTVPSGALNSFDLRDIGIKKKMNSDTRYKVCWSSSQCQYPDNLGVNFLDNLKNTEEDLENELSLPDVDISSLNVEQKFAFGQ
jgi:hypothetical protein